MLGMKLVRLIEKHCDDVAESLLRKLLASERTPSYRNIDKQELRASLVSLYAHLGEWLLTKTDADVEQHFCAVGALRASEGVPARELVWALVLSKDQLWTYVYREAAAEKALELYSELEFLETLDRFFDRAVYYALAGYEQSARVKAA